MKHETDYDVPDTDWEPDKQPSLEAQVVNLADELAYNAHDLDDGLRSGHLTPKQICDVPIIGNLMKTLGLTMSDFDQRARYTLVRELLGLMIEDTVMHTHSRLEDKHVRNIQDIRSADSKLASNSPAMSQQLRDLKQFLFQHFYRHYRLVRMITKADTVLERIFEAYLAAPDMLPPEIQQAAQKYGLMQAVTDHIASMTDRFVGDEYKRLFDPQALT